MERDWQQLEMDVDDWETALNRLSVKAGDKAVFFRISFPCGMSLDAAGFQPLAERKEIRIRLQPQSPSYAGNDEFRIAIPTQDLVWHCQESTRTDDATCLSLGGSIGIGNVDMEIHLSTSREFLEIVASEFHEQ